MSESAEDQLIRRAAKGQELAEKLTQRHIREGAVELFGLLIVMSERNRMQIELLMNINEELYKAVETGDNNFVREKLIELRLNSPLPLPIKL